MLRNLLYNHSLLFTAVIVIGFWVAISVLGHWTSHRFLALDHRRSHNDVLGFAASTIGLIYVVLLAFIASTTLISYDRADNLVNQEASIASDLFNDASVLPQPFETQATVHLKQYVEEVINVEWPNMSRGEHAGSTAWPLLRNFYRELSRAHTENPVQVAIIQEMLTRLNQLYDVRRERTRIAARPSLQPVIWFVVAAGGLIMLACTWLFGFEKRGLHLLCTILIAASLGLVIFLIVAFDYPFRGEMAISPAPFERVLDHMNKPKS